MCVAYVQNTRLEHSSCVWDANYTVCKIKRAKSPMCCAPPKDYNSESGWTPYRAEGWQLANARVNCDRSGVPGHTMDNPFYVDTPTRDKKH